TGRALRGPPEAGARLHRAGRGDARGPGRPCVLAAGAGPRGLDRPSGPARRGAHGPTAEALRRVDRDGVMAAAAKVGRDTPDDLPHTTTNALPLPRPAPGTLVAGRYRIQALLGVGGMGVVYRARDEELGVDIALKILQADRADRTET